MYDGFNDNQQLLTITDELRSLVQRAEQGDQTVLPDLRKALESNSDLWKHYGDMGRAAERSWITLTAGTNQMLDESLTRHLALLKTELAGTVEIPPLERLLIDRIAACWLQVHYADAYVAQLQSNHGAEYSLRLAADLQDRANRRYLFAIKQLALVRNLLRPNISFVQIAAHLQDNGKKAKAVRRRCKQPVAPAEDW